MAPHCCAQDEVPNPWHETETPHDPVSANQIDMNPGPHLLCLLISQHPWASYPDEGLTELTSQIFMSSEDKTRDSAQHGTKGGP